MCLPFLGYVPGILPAFCPYRRRLNRLPRVLTADTFRRQDNYQNNNQQSNYQPAFKQPDIKVAAPKIDIKPVDHDFFKTPEGRLNDDDRQMIRASNALHPEKVPDSYLNPAKSVTVTSKTGVTGQCIYACDHIRHGSNLYSKIWARTLQSDKL